MTGRHQVLDDITLTAEPVRAWKRAELVVDATDGSLRFGGVGWTSATYTADEAATCHKAQTVTLADGRQLLLVAVGAGELHEHGRVPDHRCTCGFYALRKPEFLGSVYYNGRLGGVVTLDVELAGAVDGYELGYRAERQRVLAATVDDVCTRCRGHATLLWPTRRPQPSRAFSSPMAARVFGVGGPQPAWLLAPICDGCVRGLHEQEEHRRRLVAQRWLRRDVDDGFFDLRLAVGAVAGCSCPTCRASGGGVVGPHAIPTEDERVTPASILRLCPVTAGDAAGLLGTEVRWAAPPQPRPRPAFMQVHFALSQAQVQQFATQFFKVGVTVGKTLNEVSRLFRAAAARTASGRGQRPKMSPDSERDPFAQARAALRAGLEAVLSPWPPPRPWIRRVPWWHRLALRLGHWTLVLPGGI